jgi:hypothetical protein
MRNLGTTTKKLLVAGLAAGTLAGGALAISVTPAEAGASTWRYGTPTYAQYRHRGYGHAPRYGYRHRRGPSGGAIAAGVVGGLALGALAAGAAAPAYGYPAYAAPVYGGECWVENRERVNRWGEVVIRRVRVCN